MIVDSVLCRYSGQPVVTYGKQLVAFGYQPDYADAFSYCCSLSYFSIILALSPLSLLIYLSLNLNGCKTPWNSPRVQRKLKAYRPALCHVPSYEFQVTFSIFNFFNTTILNSSFENMKIYIIAKKETNFSPTNFPLMFYFFKWKTIRIFPPAVSSILFLILER